MDAEASFVVTGNVYGETPNPNYEQEMVQHQTKLNKQEQVRKFYDEMVAKMKEQNLETSDYFDIYFHLSTPPQKTIRYQRPTSKNVKLCVHSKTMIYQRLEKEGLLQKNFPEWYAQGQF